MVADAFSAVSRAYCSPFFLASQLNSISRGAHAGEGVGHEGDEGPVTLSDKDSGVDANPAARESVPGKRLALPDGIFRAAHGRSGVYLHSLPYHYPVE